MLRSCGSARDQETEVNLHIAELAGKRDSNGLRLAVRNGYHQPRQVTTAAVVVEAKAPRVNDKRVDEATGERKRFFSAILPPRVHVRHRPAAHEGHQGASSAAARLGHGGNE